MVLETDETRVFYWFTFHSLACICSLSFQTYEDTELDGRAPLTAEARPESQSRPFTGDQNQYEGEDRAGSQSSATDEVPAERPAAGEGTSTGKGSPVRPSSQATPDQADKQKAQPVTFI